MRILKQAEAFPKYWETEDPRAFEQLDTHLHMSTDAVKHYEQQGFLNLRPELVDDISTNGIQKPLKLITDGKRGYLADGNHRVNAANHLGIGQLPVHVQMISGDTSHWPTLEPELKAWIAGQR